MIEEILRTRKKKHVQDLNIVPILDMLTTVIFFLLMSTTFIEYTKLTLPPQGTATATGPSSTRPLVPKLILRKGIPGEYVSTLAWAGEKPGQTEVKASEAELRGLIEAQIKKFSQIYPSEKTLQVSLEHSIHYQALVNVMDAARDSLPDTVLISYTEADSK